jgi:membrane protein DedA with SNARE-associated domain
LLWNALGGIAWTSTVGSLAYLLGRSASSSLGAIGFVAASMFVGRGDRLAGRLKRYVVPASR